MHNKAKGAERLVNCRYRKCSCGMWQSWRMPCKHGCRVLIDAGKDPRKFVDVQYSLWSHLQLLERAIGGRSAPKWPIIHDLV